jgi:uncharacterized membrane protein
MVLKSLEEERKMAELTQGEREEIESDIAWEKREKKIFLICTLVCFVIGTIIAVVVGIDSGIDGSTIFYGMWFGTGIGGAIGYIRTLPYVVKKTIQEEGFGEGIKTVLLGLLVWVLIFAAIGMIGFLIRLLMKNHKIKKLEKSLSAA